MFELDKYTLRDFTSLLRQTNRIKFDDVTGTNPPVSYQDCTPGRSYRRVLYLRETPTLSDIVTCRSLSSSSTGPSVT